MKYGIVAIGYNRLKGLERLLNQLNCCFYDEPIDLIISLDCSENNKLHDFVYSFRWPYGEKKVIIHSHRLGLKEHVLSCGDLLNKYSLDAIAVFEDDVFPGYEFFRFMKQAVEYYKDDDNIAGISLYQHRICASAQLPFTPQNSEYDVYFMKIAQSWGQVWTKKQWISFKSWYDVNSALWNSSDYVPDNVAQWPKSSWLKYYWRYCGETNKYFVYPYQALVTCFSEAGEHTIRSSSMLQVPLVTSWEREYHFADLDSEKAVRYDAFWENEAAAVWCAKRCAISKDDISIDIYGANRNRMHKRYWLTQRKENYKIIASYALALRPHEMNVLLGVEGNDILLYDTQQYVNNAHSKKLRYVDFIEYYLTHMFGKKTINKLVTSSYVRSVQDRIKTIIFKMRKRGR